MVIRRYPFVLLVSFLVILTGIAGVAYAVSNGCIGIHCEEHAQTAKHSVSAMSSGDISVPSHHHDPESSGTGECNPFICQVVVLLVENGEPAQGQRDIDLELQDSAQAKLNEPDSPYRPPDL